MLKERARILSASIFALDLALVTLAFGASHVIRQSALPALAPSAFPASLQPLPEFLRLLPVALAIWTCALLGFGAYQSWRVRTLRSEIETLLRIAGTSLVILALVLFSLRLDEVLLGTRISRSWVVVFTSLACVLLFVEKAAIRGFARRARARGLNFRTLLIVGTGPFARAVADAVERHAHWGYRILGFVALERGEAEADACAVLGKLRDLDAIVRTHVVDEVIFAVSPDEFHTLEGGLAALEILGIRARFALNVFPRATATPTVSDLDGIPLLTFATGPSDPWLLACKRIVDVVLAAVLLLVTLPLFVVIAASIKLTSRGSVFFRQTRCGLNGRRFTLYKLRTMVQDAEARRPVLQHLNEMDGPVFKLANDPRITRGGRFLRKFSLDELPQLWNVLRGDMSLVGPRPPIPEEVERYEPWQRRRLSMKPGLTCLWQVNGRNQVDFKRWIELDLEYIDTWSLLLDLRILAKTVPVVVTGRGAS